MPELRYERFPAGHYAVFTMDRPDRLNAQGAVMRQELQEALSEFSADPEMRAGIVTGAGRAFSAGADLKEMAEGQSDVRARQTEEQLIETFRGNQPFARNPKPFIAAVNGLAIAAGMERVADCDIRIASTKAYFGLFEVKRGILPNYAINHLARVMPFGEAMYLMLTGDTLSVEEAHRLGFVHEVLDPERLMPRAVEIAEMIGANAPLAVQGSKAVAQFWRRYGLEEAYRLNAAVGHRGIFSRSRPAGYGFSGTTGDYVAEANRNTLICLMLEEVEAIDNLKEMVKVDGVDVFFIGSGDLSQSMGYPGEQTHPEVQAMMEKGVKVIRDAGKVAGVSCPDSYVPKFLDMGVQYFHGNVNSLLQSSSLSYLKEMREAATASGL